MLGFCLVGLAILNIMIIILLFKACWYNEFLKEVLDAGRPINRCPDGDFKDVTQAQADLWAFFENQTYEQWKRNFGFAHPHGAWAKNSGTLAKPAYDGSSEIYACDNNAKDIKECAGDNTVDRVYTSFLTSEASFKAADFFYNPTTAHTKTNPVTGAHPVAAVDMTSKICETIASDKSSGTYGTHFSEFDTAGKATNACYAFTRESLCTLWEATADVVHGTGKTAITSPNAANCKTWTYDTTVGHVGWTSVNKNWGDAMSAYKGTNVLQKSGGW